LRRAFADAEKWACQQNARGRATARRRQRGQGRHGGETVDTTAARQAHQQRLGLIVGRMRRDQAGEPGSRMNSANKA
jgi:hypothetical protein